MTNFILRILPAVLFVAAAACDEEPVAVDISEAAPVVEAVTATAVLARGVTHYAVTREAAGARVVLRGASELGDLTAQTVAPGVVRLQLDWQGRALEFEVDTTPIVWSSEHARTDLTKGFRPKRHALRAMSLRAYE